MSRNSAVANPTSRKKLRETAYLLRKIIKYENDMRFPVIEFLELFMPQLDEDFQMIIETKEDMGNCHGKACPEKKIIYLREDVYDGAVKGNGRDRFTIAHEIAHYILHKPEFVSYARLEAGGKVPAYRDPEWQANTLAAELLMAYHLIKGKNIQEIACECEVSYTAAAIQLKYV